MKKMTFLVSLILIAGLSALDTESKAVDTKQDNVVVESDTVEKLLSSDKCANALQNGINTEYYENGSLKLYKVISNPDQSYKGKLKKVTSTEYYRNGTLKSFQVILSANKECKKNLEKGTSSEYHENGRLKLFKIVF